MLERIDTEDLKNIKDFYRDILIDELCISILYMKSRPGKVARSIKKDDELEKI